VLHGHQLVNSNFLTAPEHLCIPPAHLRFPQLSKHTKPHWPVSIPRDTTAQSGQGLSITSVAVAHSTPLSITPRSSLPPPSSSSCHPSFCLASSSQTARASSFAPSQFPSFLLLSSSPVHIPPVPAQRSVACYVSPRLSSRTRGIFYKCFYNHARRLRLEKLLCLELFRSSNGCFLTTSWSRWRFHFLAVY
jgi:hypothetical protein